MSPEARHNRVAIVGASLAGLRAAEALRPPAPAEASAARRTSLADRLDLPLLMIGGAVVMVVGLVLASFADAFIWFAFAGVVLFVAAFIFSLYRSGKPAPTKGASGVYWRDRYIEYEPAGQSAWSRLTSRFRKR